MDDSRNTKKILNYKPEGKRAPGRPRRRWMDNLEDDLKLAGVTRYGITTGRQRRTLEELAEEREEWRNIMSKSMAGDSRRMIT